MYSQGPTDKSEPTIVAAMALASAALLGVISTFSWSNVLNEGKLKGSLSCVLISSGQWELSRCTSSVLSASELLEQKHQKQAQEQRQEEGQEGGQWGIAGKAAAEVANASRRELESLLRP